MKFRATLITFTHFFIMTLVLQYERELFAFEYNTPRKTISINVIIHGVCNIENHISNVSSIINFLKDDIYNTYYHHNLTLFRQERSFFQFQAMQDLGLHEITDLSINPGNSCGALASIIDQTFGYISSNNRIEQRYYTYGWSGLHSVKEYRTIGGKLLDEMIALKEKFLKQGYRATIRVWGYSHGGNVALMMGHHHKPISKHLIDELVILATPFISNATVEHIASPLFKKVYNIYSLSDKVQRYDLIHPKAFLCEQKLTTKTIKKLPENLIQVRLKYTLASNHAKKNQNSFAHSKNFNKKSIILGRPPLLKDMSPGHIELWLFGWTFAHYRPNFVTYPIPAGALSIPYALYYIDDRIKTENHNPAEEFIVDVRPDHELVLINKKTKKNGTINKIIAPFFNHYDFLHLKNRIQSYNPIDLTYQQYCDKVAEIDRQTLETFNNFSSNIA